MLHRLFDYLLERTLRAESPKEVEVAADVFGKSEADLMVDASVRVYVHRLRKKLDDYYAGPGHAETERLTLPKGDYRFRLLDPDEMGDAAEDDANALPEKPFWRQQRVWLVGAVALLAGMLLTMAALHVFRADDGLADVRSSRTWASIIHSQRALTIVPGDYYIMGERDKAGAEPTRLVRDYAVNSREDLDALFMDRPDLRDRYVDLNLFYLPVSTAYAIRSVMPIVAPSLGGRRAPVIPSSKLTPADLKSGDIVYVGLMSGLGLLQQAVFTNSRFDFAGSFDELIDTQTGKIYVADPPQDGDTARRNYAYVAMLPGPNGNRILIIAGTRDPALLQAADIVNSPATLARMEEAGPDGYFEALFAVDGVGDENLKGTLIVSGPRSAEGLWDGIAAPGVSTIGEN